MFNVQFTTVSPLCQIDTTGSENLITVKKLPYGIKNEDGTSLGAVKTPIYTGNGFRGMLRRICTEMLLEKYFIDGGEISAVNFHLMNAGGGNNFSRQKAEIEEKVRELNPVISVFGTSLAVRGKLVVPNFVPMEKDENGELALRYRTSEEGRPYSDVVARESFVKQDDLLTRKGNARFVPFDTVVDWEKLTTENTQARRGQSAEEKKSDAKVKKESIQHIQEREIVIPGIDFYSSIDWIMPLSDIERGMLLRAFERAAERRLGANSNLGLGRVAYHIDSNDDGETLIESVVDRAFNSKIEVRLNLSDSDAACVKAFDDWLEGLGAENMEIDAVME